MICMRQQCVPEENASNQKFRRYAQNRTFAVEQIVRVTVTSAQYNYSVLVSVFSVGKLYILPVFGFRIKR